MKSIIINQKVSFKKAYKRLHNNQKILVDKEIVAIIDNPEIGQAKIGDLAGIFVHKFRVLDKEMLLAYKWFPEERLLLFLGAHENFYRDLKKQIL